jgi:molecular chaperone GrpE
MDEKEDIFGEEIVADEVGESHFPDVELEDEEALSKDKLKDLRTKLAASEKQKQEYQGGWQRARADFLNYKRRTEEESSQKAAQGVAKYVETLLPLLDSFALATKGTAWDTADANFKRGFEMIRSQLDTILKDLKVQTIDPKGAAFDPRYHEAIMEQPVENEAQHNTILETVQPGYQIGDTVIRAARVIVGHKA